MNDREKGAFQECMKIRGCANWQGSVIKEYATPVIRIVGWGQMQYQVDGYKTPLNANRFKFRHQLLDVFFFVFSLRSRTD